MANRDSEAFTFENLDVYQVSLELAESIYRLTKGFPLEEKFGLVSQMRRAAVSIPANVAEGWGRGKGAAQAQFVRVSRGSAYELRTMLTLSERLGFGEPQALAESRALLDRVGKLVQAYLAAIETNFVVREGATPYG